MAILTTGQIKIPDQIFDGWYGKIGQGSAVATLSNSVPMTFGPVSYTHLTLPTKA